MEVSLGRVGQFFSLLKKGLDQSPDQAYFQFTNEQKVLLERSFPTPPPKKRGGLASYLASMRELALTEPKVDVETFLCHLRKRYGEIVLTRMTRNTVLSHTLDNRVVMDLVHRIYAFAANAHRKGSIPQASIPNHTPLFNGVIPGHPPLLGYDKRSDPYNIPEGPEASNFNQAVREYLEPLIRRMTGRDDARFEFLFYPSPERETTYVYKGKTLLALGKIEYHIRGYEPFSLFIYYDSQHKSTLISFPRHVDFFYKYPDTKLVRVLRDSLESADAGAGFFFRVTNPGSTEPVRKYTGGELGMAPRCLAPVELPRFREWMPYISTQRTPEAPIMRETWDKLYAVTRHALELHDMDLTQDFSESELRSYINYNQRNQMKVMGHSPLEFIPEGERVTRRQRVLIRPNISADGLAMYSKEFLIRLQNGIGEWAIPVTERKCLMNQVVPLSGAVPYSTLGQIFERFETECGRLEWLQVLKVLCDYDLASNFGSTLEHTLAQELDAARSQSRRRSFGRPVVEERLSDHSEAASDETALVVAESVVVKAEDAASGRTTPVHAVSMFQRAVDDDEVVTDYTGSPERAGSSPLQQQLDTEERAGRSAPPQPLQFLGLDDGDDTETELDEAELDEELAIEAAAPLADPDQVDPDQVGLMF